MNTHERTIQMLGELTEHYLKTGVYFRSNWAARRSGELQAIDFYCKGLPLLQSVSLRKHFRQLARDLGRPFVHATGGPGYMVNPNRNAKDEPYHIPDPDPEAWSTHITMPRTKKLDPLMGVFLLAGKGIKNHYGRDEHWCTYNLPSEPYKKTRWVNGGPQDLGMHQPRTTVWTVHLSGSKGKQLWENWLAHIQVDPTCREVLKLDTQ